MKENRSIFLLCIVLLVLTIAFFAPSLGAWAGEQYQTVPTAPPGEEGSVPTLDVGELPTATPRPPDSGEVSEPNLVIVGIVMGILLLVVLASFISWLRWRREARNF